MHAHRGVLMSVGLAVMLGACGNTPPPAPPKPTAASSQRAAAAEQAPPAEVVVAQNHARSDLSDLVVLLARAVLRHDHARDATGAAGHQTQRGRIVVAVGWVVVGVT